MKPLTSLLVELADGLPLGAGDPVAGVTVEVTSAEIDIPVESRITTAGEYRVSAPRGILATGFDTPHGRLVARFERAAETASGRPA